MFPVGLTDSVMRSGYVAETQCAYLLRMCFIADLCKAWPLFDLVSGQCAPYGTLPLRFLVCRSL